MASNRICIGNVTLFVSQTREGTDESRSIRSDCSVSLSSIDGAIDLRMQTHFLSVFNIMFINKSTACPLE